MSGLTFCIFNQVEFEFHFGKALPYFNWFVSEVLSGSKKMREYQCGKMWIHPSSYIITRTELKSDPRSHSLTHSYCISAQATEAKTWRPSVHSGLWAQTKLWKTLHRPPTRLRKSCILWENCGYHHQSWTRVNSQINYPSCHTSESLYAGFKYQ